MTMRTLVLLLSLTLAGAAAASRVLVPSGNEVTLQEVLWQEGEEIGTLWVRLRFVAPGLAGMAYEHALSDLDALCLQVAVPEVEGDNRDPDLVIVSLAERAAPFGEFDPDMEQVFEAYRVEDGLCFSEDF
jgi:hypothetical protein